MLKLCCQMCDGELNTPGALLFAPPDHYDCCLKIHLCVKCFERVFNWIKQEIEDNINEH